jgi:hypothetical protein
MLRAIALPFAVGCQAGAPILMIATHSPAAILVAVGGWVVVAIGARA